VSGPLILPSPDGDSTEFSDGFAFTNADINDGAEFADLDISGPIALPVPDRTIDFYDTNGQLLVAFSASEIFYTLASPAFEKLPTPAPEKDKAWLVFSADGTSWEVVHEIEDFNAGLIPEVAVGDDELLLVQVNGVTRIELDD